MNIVFGIEDFRPLKEFAPNFAIWLDTADRKSDSVNNYDIMRYYGQALTAAEAIFCNNYARHIIFGLPAPNLEEGSFDCSPMYRQALLEKIVREKLRTEDGYVFPLVMKI